ncbi:hypothetical protein F2P81_008319, partial [Scophthalmus maximus]
SIFRVIAAKRSGPLCFDAHAARGYVYAEEDSPISAWAGRGFVGKLNSYQLFITYRIITLRHELRTIGEPLVPCHRNWTFSLPFQAQFAKRWSIFSVLPHFTLMRIRIHKCSATYSTALDQYQIEQLANALTRGPKMQTHSKAGRCRDDILTTITWLTRKLQQVTRAGV